MPFCCPDFALFYKVGRPDSGRKLGVEKMKRIISAVAFAAGMMAGAAAWAATLTIDSTAGSWTNVATSDGPTGPLTGAGTSKIAWGDPAKKTTLQSSYEFNSTGPVTQSSPASFLIGQFVHTNGYIWAVSTQVDQADLDVSVSGTADGQAFSLSSVFRFIHDETANEAKKCKRGGKNPCGDTVNISTISGAPLVITQGSTIFTILIDGFVQALGGPVITSFLTPELQQTPLYLQASLQIGTAPPPPSAVPVPAAGLLLAGALGAVGLIRRRRRG